MGFKNLVGKDEPNQSTMDGRGEDVDEVLNLDDLELVDEDAMEEIYPDDELAADSDNDGDEDVIIPDCDHSSFTFSKHEGPVYSCSFHPNGEIAVSGCENETLYVWNISTGVPILENKFSDSVVLAKFNHDGKFLAAADMLGNFVCWKYTENRFTQIKTMQLNSPSWMEWHPKANVLLCAEKLDFCMWKVPSFETVKYFALEGNSEAGCLMPDGKRALIGYDSGQAIILDLSTFTVVSKLKCIDEPAQEDKRNFAIISVDAHPDNNVVALGTLKGSVILFTTKNAKVIGKLNFPEVDDANSVEAVRFGRASLSGLLLIACSKRLYIYDQLKMVLRHEIVLSGCATRMICIEPYVVISTAAAVVEICDCRTGLKKMSLKGHRKPIVDMTLSSDKKKIITGSDDSDVKIYDLDSVLTTSGRDPGSSNSR